MTKITENSQEYIRLFEQSQQLINEYSVAALNAHRTKAMERFRKLGGFPTRKVEDYKYTNLDAVFGHDYGVDVKNILSKLPYKNGYDSPLDDAYTVHLKNGYLEAVEEREALEKQGVIICSLKEAATKHTALFDKYYNQQASESTDSIAALNTAFVEDGLFIHVSQGVVLDKPIQLINFLHAKSDLLVNGRFLFVVEKQAEVSFLDCTHALSCHLFLTNTVTEIYADNNSKIAYYVLQNQFDKASLLTNLFVSQKRDSEVISNILSLHAKLIRNNVTANLEEENCHNHTYGLYIAGGKEHVDNYTAINHIAPHCTSWEHFKGILDSAATTAFCGRIHVYKDAQKTQAYQTNNNLVLSNQAKANTKPQLIIEADDVSCSHGATVGQLDEQAIYYMRARGINYSQAYRMMMHAFMSEVTDKIAIPELRERVENWIGNKMQGKITYCDNCDVNCADC